MEHTTKREQTTLWTLTSTNETYGPTTKAKTKKTSGRERERERERGRGKKGENCYNMQTYSSDSAVRSNDYSEDTMHSTSTSFLMAQR